MDRIRILVVDDHSIVRTGLISLLGTKDGLQVVGEASTGDEAIEKARTTHPDVIVMDLMMPGKDGAATTAEIHRTNPDIRILILTSFATPDLIADALDSGASGALLKSSSNGELIDAIRTVAAGRRVVADDIEQLIGKDPPIAKLSQRQSEILESITRGLTNQEMSKQFGISPNSVKRHLQILFDKLGASNRSEAASIALRKHLLKV